MTRTLRLGLALSALNTVLFVAGCGGGGSSKPAEEPDPSLDMSPPQPGGEEGPGAVEKASSSKVQEGIDAIQKEDFEAAKTALTEARKQSPNDPQAAYYLGVAQHALGDTAAARKDYEDALKLDPKLVEASVNLSQIELEAKELPKALATVDAALKNAPRHPDLLLNRAVILEAQGKKEESLKAYGEAAAAKPDDPALHIAYADLLRQAGKRDEAVKQLRQATNTDDPTLLGAAARQFGLNEAFADCVAALDKAIKVKPTPELYVHRGVCRHGMKDNPGAVADYEAALKLDPNFAHAHYYMGKELSAKDKKKALEHYDKAAKIAGNQGVGPAAKKEADELRKKK